MLTLKPSDILKFEGPFDRVSTTFLDLSNSSRDKRIGFKVKTTAPKRYCVRPNSGIVEPGGETKIAIMLQPIDVDNPNEDLRKHKFMVQSVVLPDGEINLDTLWKNVSSKDVTDAKIRCAFEPNANAASNTGVSPTRSRSPARSVTDSTVSAEVKRTTTGGAAKSTLDTPTILTLKPSDILKFEGPYDRVSTTFLDLLNTNRDKRIGFKVKTTAPKRYCVRPNSGIVEPGGDTRIAIMLQPIDISDPHEDLKKHKFMVQSVVLPDGDVNLDTLWKEVSPEKVTDAKIRCSFDLPTNVESTTGASPTQSRSPARSQAADSTIASGTSKSVINDAQQSTFSEWSMLTICVFIVIAAVVLHYLLGYILS